jgi:hypothetical protein
MELEFKGFHPAPGRGEVCRFIMLLTTSCPRTSVTSTTGLPIEVSCDIWKDTSHEDTLEAASL